MMHKLELYEIKDQVIMLIIIYMPNTTSAESIGDRYRYVSNGFKIRVHLMVVNRSGQHTSTWHLPNNL
jgi:hypothetical protein